MYQEQLQTPPPSATHKGFWLKLGDAAHALGVSEITLRRKVKCGKLAHDFRGGRYYVYLYKDEATGRFYEPDDTEAPSPRYERAPGSAGLASFGAPLGVRGASGSTSLGVSGRGSTLPTISLRESRPHGSALAEAQRRELQERVQSLEAATAQKEASLQALRRAVEDQQTLIAFLEETIERLGRANAPSPMPPRR
jgi:hypothetical protein